MNELLHFTCPHCKDIIQIDPKELNCRIFRHAIYKDNNQQLNPHASKEECEDVIKKGLVYGCAKPFRIVTILGVEIIAKCKYI